MCEKRILIASLLKPINDTRLYEKLGLSLAKLAGVQVHIAAYEAPLPEAPPHNLFFHPLFRFRRLSFGRLRAQLRFFRLLLRLKPDIVIASTHELLPVSFLYTLLSKSKLEYDIQENYALNLQAQQNYPWLLKHLFAFLVRSTEQLIAPAVAHFLVAEQTYLQELPFLEHRYTLIENKYKPGPNYRQPPFPVHLSKESLRLLYSGTIAEVYGIFEAIALADQFHQVYPGTTLTIIGYCAQPATLEKIRTLIRQKPYITLIGGNNLVPHQQIIDQIQKSDVGLLPYQPNESTFRCIPTKLYEYMAHALPMLLQHNPLWETILAQANAGIAVDFSKPAGQAIGEILFSKSYYQNGVPDMVYWDAEEVKLLQVMGQLLA
ncbi:glycosyltransferase family protein [Botryobacter ruber]|uniref:glycosyltransferase n=1 Tax=Botryobacter ruber TaxID=2171629 RepID=UPI000E0A5715|nr:glycosyltransferase [Botryobacter ruber]